MNTHITSPYFWRRLAARLFIGLLLMSFLIQPGAQATAQTDPTCFTLNNTGTTDLGRALPYNDYWPGTTSAVAGDNHLHLGVRNANGSGTNISDGDLLLVIQMQGAQIGYVNDGTYGSGSGSGGSGYTSTGLVVGYYEYVVANNASPFSGSGSIDIISTGASNGLVNGYTNAAATSTQGKQTFQVVRVPTYLNISMNSTGIYGAPWDGSSGGVIALEVVNAMALGTSTNTRYIYADGLGFVGGVGRLNSGSGGAVTDYRTRSTVNYNASKGEGIAGTPTGYPDGTNSDASYARGAPGNAGGGGNDANNTSTVEDTGGGGGGNGGAGGVGGYTNSGRQYGGRGGSAFAERSGDRLVMGGGGGAGVNDGTASTSTGGIGGGMVFLRIGSKTGTRPVTINAFGDPGGTTTTDGGGGGGAGGSVLLISNTAIDTTVNINAYGGNGGATSASHGPGGGGGGGVVYYTDAPGTVTVAAGAAGTGGSGAAAGTAGYAGTTASTGTGAHPGFECYQPTAVQLVKFSATPGFNPNWLLAIGIGILFVAVLGAFFYRKARSTR